MPARRAMDESDGRPSLWRLLTGPATALLFILVLSLFERASLAIPNPGVVLALSVAWAAFLGGVVPGLASALFALLYLTWCYSLRTWPLGFADEHLARLPALYLSLPALAVLVGLLQSRTRAALHRLARTEAAARFRDVFDRAGDAIFVADPDGRYRSVNHRACELTGYTEAELLGMRMSDLVAPGELARMPFRIAELNQRKNMRTERRLKRRDGSTLIGEISASITPEGRLLGIVRDVTRQHEAMDKLRHANSLQQATLESTTDGILVVDPQGRWVGYNQRMLQMWRITPELASRRDGARVLESVRDQLADPFAFLAKIEELYASPAESSFDLVEFRDGRTFERYSQPQMLDGKPVGRVWSFRDVTDQRRQAAALRESELRWQQTQKLEALGRLAGGVAHDFNNMLLAILGEAELLEQALPPGSPHLAGVRNIRNAGERSAGLTRQLLAFGRRQPVSPREVDLTELLMGIEPLLRRIVGVQARLLLEVPGDGSGPRVIADPGQLEQAVLNLVVNASDAMPGGGDLRVVLLTEMVAPAAVSTRGARAAGPHAVIEVADTGVGIPAEVRPYLYEPFFTTKEAGKGTGLGLASVYGTVEQAGGFLELESEVGRGTTFRVLLPALPARAPGEPRAQDEYARGGATAPLQATLLVAEDESLVRQFVCFTLRRLGCEVLEAASGEHALAIAESHEGTIDLLLTDVIMPGMTGPELAAALAPQRPGMRVLLMSGYPGDELPLVRDESNSPPLLSKPFGGEELERRVREMLAQR